MLHQRRIVRTINPGRHVAHLLQRYFPGAEIFLNGKVQDQSRKGAALRQAKLDLLKEFGNQALPVYWAGFTLVGDGSTPISN